MTFIKGVSGNPSGRKPKGKTLTDELDKVLCQRGPGGRLNRTLLAEQAVKLAIAGNVKAMMLVFSYIDGKPVQPVDMEVRAYAEQVASVLGADPADIISLAERRKVKAS